MYHPVRKKMIEIITSAVLVLTITYPSNTATNSIETNIKLTDPSLGDENFDNNIIDFDEDYSIKFNKKYGTVPWHGSNKFNKERHRYTIVNDSDDKHRDISKKINFTAEKYNEIKNKNTQNVQNTNEDTTTQDYSVIPLELVSTTENILISIIESTAEPDLTVIPLTTTEKVPKIEINEIATLPVSTEIIEISDETTENVEKTEESKFTVIPISATLKNKLIEPITLQSSVNSSEITTEDIFTENIDDTTVTTKNFDQTTIPEQTSTIVEVNSNFTTLYPEILKLDFNNHSISIREFIETTTNAFINDTAFELLNITNKVENLSRSDLDSTELYKDVPLFTELDTEDQSDVPEDYYDSKDVVPTTAPRTDALSVIFGLAGSVVESVVETVAERVVPKSIFDLFKRMQRQNEALEAEKLRSPEENGGLGQFTRGIIKSLSTGISKPLSQLMAGVRDIGSLDTDRGFVSSLASGVTSVANAANSVVDTFKDRVQAIYPGTVWCGDGRSATARSSDLGLFFWTDTCCRQHDACKLYIRAGETKYGLTNTGLFTRSHCSCDAKFRECLRHTNSLVSAQIGLTYFNVLGPQCFRRAHPIVRCVRKTRITGLKCEEYELDYTKPRMWQWFDNETF